MDDDYVHNLEEVIKQILRPLKDVPFNIIIEAIADRKVIPFDPNDEKDATVLDKLIEATKIAGEKINQEGIVRMRPNEVGNDIEHYIKDALLTVGYKADTPTTDSGKKKGAGYPDIEFMDEFGRINYIECKTYNQKTISTTQRSFYLSPSDDFKVTRDAHHFVISLEIYIAGRQDNMNIYKCKSWKILSIEKLLVDVKHEFNSDNRRLYSEKHILAQGNF